MNDVSFRVKAYIENGWADIVINPDLLEGSSSSRESEQFDSTVLPPTQGWKSIKSAYQSLDDVTKFSMSNVIDYFVMRTASDGKAVNDFKLINQSAENLIQCGHVQGLSIVYKDEYWWIKADCRPEMKKDKMYKMMMSLLRIMGYKFCIVWMSSRERSKCFLQAHGCIVLCSCKFLFPWSAT